jgi:preprotein translocase subunit SecB
MTEPLYPETSANPFELAIPVSDRVQIKSVFVIESRIKRGDDEQFTRGGFGLKYHHEVKRHDVDQDASQIRLQLSFSVITTKDGEPEAEPLLLIETTLALVYSLDSFDGIDEQNVRAFAETNGVYNAWPYWREFVQSATVRMGLPALVPPVFRFDRQASEPSTQVTNDPSEG